MLDAGLFCRGECDTMEPPWPGDTTLHSRHRRAPGMVRLSDLAGISRQELGRWDDQTWPLACRNEYM